MFKNSVFLWVDPYLIQIYHQRMPSLSKQKPKRVRKTLKKLQLKNLHQLSHTNRTSNHKQSFLSKQSKSPIPSKKFQSKCDLFLKDNIPTRKNRMQTAQSKERGKNETFNTTINNTRSFFDEKEKNNNSLKLINEQLKQRRQELFKLQNKIMLQQQALKLSQLKAKSFQSIYTNKMNQILKGRKQIEIMATQLQQKLRKIQSESDRMEAKSKSIQRQSQQLTQLKRELNLKRQSHQKIQKQLQLTIRQLQSKSLSLQKRQYQIEKTTTEQFAKEIQLRSRQSHMNSYVKDLNICIKNLKDERGNFETIAGDLGQRCEQLEGIEIKIWKQLMNRLRELGGNQGFRPNRSVREGKQSSKKWITIHSCNEEDIDEAHANYK